MMLATAAMLRATSVVNPDLHNADPISGLAPPVAM